MEKMEKRKMDSMYADVEKCGIRLSVKSETCFTGNEEGFHRLHRRLSCYKLSKNVITMVDRLSHTHHYVSLSQSNHA